MKLDYIKKVEYMKQYEIITLENEKVYYNDLQKAKKRAIKEKCNYIKDLKNNKIIDLSITTYIIYKYNKIKNDIEYIAEYNNIKDLQRDYNIKNAYQNTTSSLESITHLIDNKYVIFKDKIYINEL
jgi:hypothetical protein